MDNADRLKELTVFRTSPMSFGLPRSLFIALAMVSFGQSIVLAWWIGPAIFLVAYAPLYRAHQEDPNAHVVWRAAFTERIGVIDPGQTRFLTTRYE